MFRGCGAAGGLLEKFPAGLKNSPEAQFLRPAVDDKVYNIVHRIYRAKNHESLSKDYEFSRGGNGGTLARRLS
jgi:NTE family protein